MTVFFPILYPAQDQHLLLSPGDPRVIAASNAAYDRLTRYQVSHQASAKGVLLGAGRTDDPAIRLQFGGRASAGGVHPLIDRNVIILLYVLVQTVEHR